MRMDALTLYVANLLQIIISYCVVFFRLTARACLTSLLLVLALVSLVLSADLRYPCITEDEMIYRGIKLSCVRMHYHFSLGQK